jgi:hypothetical protein
MSYCFKQVNVNELILKKRHTIPFEYIMTMLRYAPLNTVAYRSVAKL